MCRRSRPTLFEGAAIAEVIARGACTERRCTSAARSSSGGVSVALVASGSRRLSVHTDGELLGARMNEAVAGEALLVA